MEGIQIDNVLMELRKKGKFFIAKGIFNFPGDVKLNACILIWI